MAILDNIIAGELQEFPAPRIECKDGFSVSVQTHYHAYRLPRYTTGGATAAELGFPSSPPPEYIVPYAESEEDLTNTVYPFVPVELVRRMIADHGGEK